MERLFVDTSAWLAFVNRNDRDHAAVSAALNRFRNRLVTTNFVFDETVTLAARRLGHRVAARLGEILREPEVGLAARIRRGRERTDVDDVAEGHRLLVADPVLDPLSDLG